MTAPNVLLVVTDQQRKDSVGAYGSLICQTPNMDRIAGEGMRFDRAYTPTGLCSPVRCTLLSGVFPHAHNVLTNVTLHPIRESLAPEHDRLGAGFRERGYRLGYAGKWHVSDTQGPLEFGYDDYFSLGDYMEWRKAEGHPIPEAFTDYRTQVADRDPLPAELSRPHWLADRAKDMIGDYSAEGKPFFVRLDFHGPHFPNVVPEPFFSMYPPEDIPPWPNAFDDLADKPAVHTIKKKHWHTDQFEWSDWQRLISAYFGEITLIDDAVGKVLDRLDELGLAENTLVIWTTDHGDTIGAHGICNKDYTMYEEIYNVPMLARWPGVVEPGTTSDAFSLHFLDIFATLREVSGAGQVTPCHGRSLVPILKGETPGTWRADAFCEFHGSHMGLYSMRLLRTERWAYVYQPNDIDELYDMETDPAQMKNLAQSPEHADVLARLKRRMVEWMDETEDHIHNEWTVLWLTEDEHLAMEAPGRRTKKW